MSKILSDEINISIDSLTDKILLEAGVDISVLRLDKIDPITGGNKWFKLKYNIEECIRKKHDTILTFGGAYSNHIAATASVAHTEGLKSIGIIRGEEVENKTLLRAKAEGMQLHFVSREDYRKLRDQRNFPVLENKFGRCYIIPEGGSNELGVKGCERIAELIPTNAEMIFIPVGTAATISGLIRGLNRDVKVIGVPVLNAKDYFNKQIEYFLRDQIPTANYILNHDYVFGGYAKSSELLNKFVDDFNSSHNLKVEPIYTGKMFFACFDMIKKGTIPSGTKIVLIHTGGLQYLSE